MISDIGKESQTGFLPALFKNDFELSQEEFIKRVQRPECAWIFDDEAIRKRYKKEFNQEEVLAKVEKELNLVDKDVKLSLAEWQFLKHMNKQQH